MARLDGRTLLLTRTKDDSDDWAGQLAAEGADPIVLPCIETENLANATRSAALKAAVVRADWLVFTSKRGVDACRDAIGAFDASRLKIAAVGEQTAARARERFGRVDMIGGGTAARLGNEFARLVGPGARIVLALAANAGTGLENALAATGAIVSRFDVYRTIPCPARRPKRALSTLGADTVIFASPTAVTGFDNQVKIDLSPKIVTIGPSTSQAVRQHDWPIAAEAREPSLSGIIESLVETAHG